MNRIPKHMLSDTRAPLSAEALKEFWNNFGSTYATGHESLTIVNAMVEFDKIIKRAPKQFNLRLLELACGSGYMPEYILRTKASHFSELRFMDISDFMVSETRKRIEGINIDPKIDFKLEVRNCEDLGNLPDNHYDIVLANLVIHLVTNPDNVFRGIKKCLSEKGQVFMSYTDEFKNCKFFLKFNEVLRKYDSEKSKNRQMFYFPQENIMDRLLKDHGFVVVEESVNDVVFNNGNTDLISVYKDMLASIDIDKRLSKEKFGQLIEDLKLMIDQCNKDGTELSIRLINKHIVRAD